MKLVIAEKNEAARDIAVAICGLPCKPADVKLPAEGNGYRVFAASGHLLGLAEPAEVDARYGRCPVEDLPIRIYPWPKRPQGEYQESKLAAIGSALAAGPDEVYHAGDADDEGQLIVDEILEHFGWDPADERVKRVYVNDNIAKNIRRAFDCATPNAQHVPDGLAAQARSLGDFCFGVNESRLASAKLKAKLSVGRVQTPTLGLVVERDRAREGHSSREYYEVACSCSDGSDGTATPWEFAYKPPEDALEDGKHCFDREFAEGAAHELRGSRFTCEIRVARKEKAAPLPFNLTDLTADMSKRFKMTANDVMEATQTLRDQYKAITYNRAESRHLPEEAHVQAPAVTAVVARNIGWEHGYDTSIKHAAFDDSKVSAHHGIIPQETELDLASMPQRERLVYEAIAVRYLLLFAPPLVFDEAMGESPSGIEAGGMLSYKKRHMVEPGWAACAPAGSGWCTVSTADGEAPAPGTRDFKVEKAELATKKTTPPPAFTDGTLMVAMSNIARYVKDPEVKRVLKEKDENSTTEHGSIGTSATRKDIIEALIARGYIARGSKGKIASTEKGRKFYDVVPDAIKGADLTAKWYLIQKAVGEGEARPDAVMASVCEEFERHRESAYAGVSLRETAGTCPRCGQPVEKRGRAWSCASNKSEKLEDGTFKDVAGCGFKVLPFCGKELTAKQVEALLAGKKVPLKGCVSKRTGKKFDCKVALLDGELKPEFESKGSKGGRSAYSNKTAKFASMADFKKRKGAK